MVLALHNATDFGYDKVAKANEVPKPTVQESPGPRQISLGSTHKIKLAHTARKVVEGIVDSNSHLPLRGITDLANNKLNEPLAHTAVDEILSDSSKWPGVAVASGAGAWALRRSHHVTTWPTPRHPHPNRLTIPD